MAPDDARGEPTDARSDVWSLIDPHPALSIVAIAGGAVATIALMVTTVARSQPQPVSYPAPRGVWDRGGGAAAIGPARRFR